MKILIMLILLVGCGGYVSWQQKVASDQIDALNYAQCYCGSLGQDVLTIRPILKQENSETTYDNVWRFTCVNKCIKETPKIIFPANYPHLNLIQPFSNSSEYPISSEYTWNLGEKCFIHVLDKKCKEE